MRNTKYIICNITNNYFPCVFITFIISLLSTDCQHLQLLYRNFFFNTCFSRWVQILLKFLQQRSFSEQNTSLNCSTVSSATSSSSRLTFFRSFSTFRSLYTVAIQFNLRNCESSANHVSSRVESRDSGARFEHVKISSRSVRRPCCIRDEAVQDRFVRSFVRSFLRSFVRQDFSLHRSEISDPPRIDTMVGR